LIPDLARTVLTPPGHVDDVDTDEAGRPGAA
jgi:hypothetical protein